MNEGAVGSTIVNRLTVTRTPDVTDPPVNCATLPGEPADCAETRHHVIAAMTMLPDTGSDIRGSLLLGAAALIALGSGMANYGWRRRAGA